MTEDWIEVGEDISTGEGEPGFARYSRLRLAGYKIEVYLNGTIDHRVFFASPSQGFVMRYVFDDAGDLIIRDGDLATEEFRGRVTVVAFPEFDWKAYALALEGRLSKLKEICQGPVTSACPANASLRKPSSKWDNPHCKGYQ